MERWRHGCRQRVQGHDGRGVGGHAAARGVGGSEVETVAGEGRRVRASTEADTLRAQRRGDVRRRVRGARPRRVRRRRRGGAASHAPRREALADRARPAEKAPRRRRPRRRRRSRGNAGLVATRRGDDVHGATSRVLRGHASHIEPRDQRAVQRRAAGDGVGVGAVTRLRRHVGREVSSHRRREGDRRRSHGARFVHMGKVRRARAGDDRVVRYSRGVHRGGDGGREDRGVGARGRVSERSGED